MKEVKWYNKILNSEQKKEELYLKNKRLEIYELFKKNKYKTDAIKDSDKRNG